MVEIEERAPIPPRKSLEHAAIIPLRATTRCFPDAPNVESVRTSPLQPLEMVRPTETTIYRFVGVRKMSPDARHVSWLCMSSHLPR